jgi:hypothetical protein
MAVKKIKHLKKLYVQFDNAPNNKGWSVVIGLAVLIFLGIVDKIVVAFLLVGHTHTDVDRIISYIVTYLRGLDISNLDKLKEYVLESFNPKVNIFFSSINMYVIPLERKMECHSSS